MKYSLKNPLNNFWAAAAATFLCLSVPFCGFGATISVTVVNFAFVPAATNIFAGDRVIWTWVPGANAHNVTSTSSPQAWPASATLNGPATFTNTFGSSGTFPYKCTVHMFTGSIVVVTNLPPTVTITNPVSGTVFAAPANVTIQALASDTDGTVTNVQFLVGTTVLTNETTAPFSAVTNSPAAGGYTLSAIASDNAGLTATNAVTISVVTPVQVTLGAPIQLSSTNFQFSYSADVGLTYVIQLSTDLTSPDWIAIFTNVATSSPMIFMDSNATNNPGFYRVELLPNP